MDRGQPYCEADFKRLFCVKCARCKRPIGGGDRWVEAMDDPWHTACFKCEVGPWFCEQRAISAGYKKTLRIRTKLLHLTQTGSHI